MNRIEILQALINKNGYTNFLEIGVQNGHCFNAIECENKVGVDPDTGLAATIHKTSDDFFEENKQKFDICFVDGLHHADQVFKDVINCLSVLKEGGTIVMHDCLPTDEFMQLIPHTTQDCWVGDTWKAFVKLRMERTDLSLHVVDTDWGCSIVTKGTNELLVPNVTVDYQGFVANRNHWMNVISVQQFIDMYLI